MSDTRRYSFFQLFSKGTEFRPGDYKVVIPIIQRDYAQGRSNEKAQEVRTDFLTQLYDYMTAPSGSHDLDFVYGISSTAIDTSKKKEFVPLDGQQRLTTLFLIHIYLALRCKGTEESTRFFKTIHLKSGRLTESLFSYRTRSSAVEFCDGLVDVNNDFSEVFIKDDNGKRTYEKPLSEYICNINWFYPDWLQDPTVNGMLTMLDAIDEKFDECNHRFILSRLLSDKNPSVAFIFMDLEDYKLTDDLYIKMNSRGKPLTPFENFKAKYEQYIANLEKGVAVGEDEAFDASGIYEYSENKDGRIIKIIKTVYDFEKEILERGDKIIKTVKDNFAFNIDTNWSNIFWDYSKVEIQQREQEIKLSDIEDKSKSIDSLLSETLDLKISRFIKMVLVNQYAMDHSIGKISIPDDLISDKPLSFTGLNAIDAISPNGVILMTRMFELFSNRRMEIMPEWTHIRYYDEEDVFEAMVKGKDFTYPKRFLMYCYLAFRMRFGDLKTQYIVEWMRFMYNVTLDDNSIQDLTRFTYHRAIASVNSLLELLNPSNPSLLDLLASDNAPADIDFFPDYQYLEEKLKSHLFKRDDLSTSLHGESDSLESAELDADDAWGRIILKLEAHAYFTGQIGFILKMAGILDYYEAHNNLNWSEIDDKSYKKAVIRYGEIASMIFDGGYSKRVLAKKALLERAMLAKFPQYLDRNFLNSTNKRAGSNDLLRDWSWKSNLRLSPDHEDVTRMVKELFDMLDVDDIIGSLQKVIDSMQTGPLWEKDIVRYDYLMEKSRNGFFARSDDGHRILKNSINFSKDDHEVYSYVLYRDYLSQEGSVSQISDFWLSYGTSNSNTEVPFIRLTAGNNIVKVKSCINPDNGELKCHYLHLNSQGDSDLEQFLIGHGFCRMNDSNTIFWRMEEEWDGSTKIDDYRRTVSQNISDFITDLSSYIKQTTDGQ